MSIEDRHEIAERAFVHREERSFRDRARADRDVGLWAAGHLGLDAASAEAYATGIMNAGVASRDGRGGFDRAVADLAATPVNVEMVRTRYAMAMASTPGALFAADMARAAARH